MRVKRIVPFGLQVPTIANGASQSSSGRPPSAGIFFNLPSA